MDIPTAKNSLYKGELYVSTCTKMAWWTVKSFSDLIGQGHATKESAIVEVDYEYIEQLSDDSRSVNNTLCCIWYLWRHAIFLFAIISR